MQLACVHVYEFVCMCVGGGSSLYVCVYMWGWESGLRFTKTEHSCLVDLNITPCLPYAREPE